MTKRAPDWWLSAWDEYGHSFDTGRIVPITAGILHAPDGAAAMAVSVAGETPIILTPDTVARFRECLNWAVDEQQLLRRADQATDGGQP
ncbi:MAG: hypothetical protein GEU86_22200 [Actinophytocola sp.]|nr:hypothetical protein [Actinophytocola sp.]